MQLRKGFTLSEVLVTIGVIGVVSAITLPVLSKMYKKIVVKNQIKQSYSLISNAVNLVVLDDDFPHECYYGLEGVSTAISECNGFFDAIISKLETTKVCESNSYTNGCVPNYKNKNFPSTVCSGFSVPNIKQEAKSAVLKNGIIIFTHSYSSKSTYPLIAFDINGFKGPNKPGHDIYAIKLYAKQKGYPIYGLPYNNSVNIIDCLNTSDSTMLFKNLSEILK